LVRSLRKDEKGFLEGGTIEVNPGKGGKVNVSP